MFDRHAKQLLEKLITLFPCTVVTGVRQCGKTTLLSEFSPPWQCFDMETGSDQQQILDDPDLFLRLHPNQTIIDEAQQAPSLFPALRVAIDQQRSQTGRFLLSGSSSPALNQQIAESLAGRVASIELSPLTLTEAWRLPPSPIYSLITLQAPIEQLLEQAHPRLDIQRIYHYWLKGGYPELWERDQPDLQKLWYQNYIDTYLMRDISTLFPRMDRNRYRQLILLMTQASGTILNNAQFARTLGVSEPTIRDWLQIAHDTFIWRQLPAWDRSKQKQLVKHPKGFLRDSGMMNHLLHINSIELLTTHPAAGLSWESMVIENLLRNFNNRGDQVTPYHYRTRGGAEIDLILEGDFGLLPIEIKMTSTPGKRQLRALNEFIDQHNCRYGIVVTGNNRAALLDERIITIPAATLSFHSAIAATSHNSALLHARLGAPFLYYVVDSATDLPPVLPTH